MDNQAVKEESFSKLFTEFQEQILEVCNLRIANISDQLQQILGQEFISSDIIQQYFKEIQDEKQLNQIVSITNEYHLRYQEERKEIQKLTEQSNLATQNNQIQESAQNSLMKDKEIILSSYQQIEKEGMEQISKIIQPQLQNCDQSSLDSFISYLVQNVENFDKKALKFQDILDGLDLSNKQLNQILEIWEEFRLKLIEKKKQINEIESKISLMIQNNNQQDSQNAEQNEGNHNQTDTIGNLKTEIEELQRQIAQLTQEFQEFVTKYLQDQSITINIESIEQLIKKLNLDEGIKNQVDIIDQILETFDLSRKQEKEIQAELQRFNEEIQKRRVTIKDKNRQINQLKEQQEKAKNQQQDPNKKNILINKLIEKLNQESGLDWNVTHKEILEQLLNYLKDKIENKLEIQEQDILKIIENVELNRRKEKNVINHINNYISDFNQLFQIQRDPKHNLFNKLIEEINKITSIDWRKTHQDTTEKLISYIKEQLSQNEQILEETLLKLIENVELSRAKEKLVISSINTFLSINSSQLNSQDTINQQINKKEKLINELIQKINEVTSVDWTKNYDSTVKQLTLLLQTNQEICEEKLLSIIESVELSRIKEKQVLQLIKNFQLEYKKLLPISHPKEKLKQGFIQQINNLTQIDWTVLHKDVLESLFNYIEKTLNSNQGILEKTILDLLEKVELSRPKEKQVVSLINKFIDEFKILLPTLSNEGKFCEQSNDNSADKQFNSIFDSLVESKKEICKKQIEILKNYILSIHLSDSTKLIQCQIIIAKYVGQENFILALLEIENIVNMKSFNAFKIYQNWYEQLTETNQELTEFVLFIQQNYYSKIGKLIQNDIIEKLITSLSNQCQNEIVDIFDNLEFSNKQTNEVLLKWKQYQDEINKDNYQPELLEFKKFIQNQINNKSLKAKLNNHTAQIIVNLLKTSNEEDRNELDEIYEQFNLTKKQIIQIEQEYINSFKTKTSNESQKKINEPKEISREILEKSSKSRRNKDVSKIYTLAFQQQEICLDFSGLKVICDFQKIQELMDQVDHDQVKCVAFYGDFLLSMKIIQNYFPKAANLINFDSYKYPKHDQLVAITDGSIIFLILQEQKEAFEGDIFENEEGQLFIRFLLDSCPILITCLSQQQVSSWTNRNPFEQFDAIVPPKQIKDRSSIVAKQIEINSNIKVDSQVLLSNDQNNTMIKTQLTEAFIIDDYFYRQYDQLINNYQHDMRKLFLDENMDSNEKIEKIKEKKSKHTELQIIVQQLYENFEVKLTNLYNSFENKNLIEEILLQPSNKNDKQLKQINQSDIKEGSNQREMEIEEEQKVNQEQNQVDLIENDSRLNQFYLHLKKNFVCEDCTKNIDNIRASKYECKNCLAFSEVVSNVQDQISKKKSHKIFKMFSSKTYYDLAKIIDLINKSRKKIIFSELGEKINNQSFFRLFDHVQEEVINNINIGSYPFKKEASDEILNFIFISTYQIAKNIVEKREQINQIMIKEKDEFLDQLSKNYLKLVNLKEQRISIQPLLFTYDPTKKDEVLLNINYKIQNAILNDKANQLIEYISYDDQVDYVIFNNKNQLDKKNWKTFIYMINKKKVNSELKYIFQIAGSIDVCLFINQYSRQWVIFANDTKKNSIGKINLDYSFEEGRIDTNVYYQKTQQGKQIERVDQCIILNEKNNVIILYEKSKKQFYELFLSGQLKELKFGLQREIKIDRAVQVESVPLEESGDIEQVKNSSEGDFYAFQTKNFIYLTNPSYIVKEQIKLKENFSNFKIVTSDNSVLIIILYKNNNYECYLIQGIDESDDLVIMSNISDEKEKIGNIVIDKVIKSIVHYGNNNTSIGCPQLIHQLFFYEKDQKENITNLEKQTEKYFNDCIVCKNIQFNITYSSKYCFSSIDLLINKIDSLLQAVDFISKDDLQFILQTRIPIQLTTIQQSNYLPLKDGLFKQDLMNVPEMEDQIEQIKKQISFGWIENMVQLQNKEIYVVAMCGRQSVGKSSQLNRLFGTRFGVSASRCTDGIWMGLSKIDNKLILVLDCEGLFSIRRTDDEEVKLLLQITSISDITVIFCDIDGISQPLLSLFKKLQICIGKLKSDSFFLGTMVLLTKNVSDEGDKKKLHQESQIHLNKKETKATLSKIFPKGVSYGFLKSFLAKDYDSNLQKVRDDLFYKEILLKNKPKNSFGLMNILKYSMIQIYLNDDQDIDLISKQSEIKEEYHKFIEYFYDISKQTFIKKEKLEINFEYKPITEEEKQFINYQKTFKYVMNIKQNFQNDPNNSQEQTNLDIINQLTENNLEEDDTSDQVQAFNFLLLNQSEVYLFPQYSHNINLDKKSQNCETLLNIFEFCFKVLERANFDNYKQQMQTFFDMFIEQRKATIKEYFDNRMPKDNKYRDIVNKYEKKLNNILNSIDKQLILCTQQCNKCNRTCFNIQGHKGNCNCGTFHKCYFKCEICKSENECFLTSGHSGTHYCQKMNHLCQKGCQISSTCREMCTLEPHSDKVKHSCQGQHKCESQCRLYEKCGKTCSLQNGHEELNHLCDSTQCYDKCELCDKPCGFNLHDHDLLLSNPQKNKEFLMKEGKLVLKHLCGDIHTCVKKCEKPGVCSIAYKAEEKIWESKSSKFEYQFIKPHKTQKECSIKIEPWETSHEGQHECENFQPHRCDQQCPECQSYCIESYNHPGNHHSKNHRNKENCVFVSESDQIKIDTELGNTRKYIPGESSTPENCLQSCLRMGRAHVHLRVCNGGDECAEKKYSFARHSTKTYKPFTELDYDEMLCKGYWNSINWEPPAEEENLQIIQSCNTACAHESHGNLPNFCTKLAWHEGPHQIEYKNCDHIGSGIVDICFTIDTTGSMEWVMSSVSQTVNDILKKFEGIADIKYSIVSYRDHPPQDNTYVYKIDSQLTDKLSIQQILKNMSADGGGDTPEAVMDGLYYSLTKINWRENSQRYIFHICDSPPHGEQFGFSSSDPSWTENGCPCGIDEYDVADQLRENKVFYYLVKEDSSLNMMEEIFQGVFGEQYKQTIELSDTNKLNIQIVSALSKEIYASNEFYHIQKNKS